MDPRRLGAHYFTAWAVSLFTLALVLSPPLAAEPGKFIVTPVAQKKLSALPPGPLYWRIENFPTFDLAKNAADASPTSLAANSVSACIFHSSTTRHCTPTDVHPSGLWRW